MSMGKSVAHHGKEKRAECCCSLLTAEYVVLEMSETVGRKHSSGDEQLA